MDVDAEMAPAPQAEAAPDGERLYNGIVARYAQSLGAGFIECEEVRRDYDLQIIVPAEVLEKAGAYVGDAVSFRAGVNSKGLPQARPGLKVVQKGNLLLQFKGVIKAWNSQKGYGFVYSTAAKAQYKRDVYVKQDMAGGFYVGQRVMFNAELNESGMPVVTEMLPLKIEKPPEQSSTADMAGMAGMPGMGVGGFATAGGQAQTKVKPVVKGKGKTKAGKMAMNRPEPEVVIPEGASRSVGTVKTFSEKTGYGFIECPEAKEEYNRDVFVRNTDLKGYPVGTEVSFVLIVNKRGMPHAHQVRSTAEPEPQPMDDVEAINAAASAEAAQAAQAAEAEAQAEAAAASAAEAEAAAAQAAEAEAAAALGQADSLL
eukprot:gnl/TRDRNA2_/TRDRNA2_170124_c3_seq1.p1 gnl/TRDRNA2_/TRDRNA2_170124_c3~~gnl/TRDRNA2_/TRDRNA2_170124_c3_seq1.p1  ORF type:complete len:417 (+),score=105.18 gnl/TRDRNA2_/TRDRNA2_170124_c3_seq1:139-1251(+)